MSKNNKIRRKDKRIKKRLKQKKRKNRKINFKSPFFELNNPLKDLSNEDRKKILEEITQNATPKMESNLNQLFTLLKEYDPLILMTTVVSHGLCVGVSDNGIKKTSEIGKIQQSHVEFLQALILTIPADQIGTALPNSAIIQNVWDLLIETFQLNNLVRMNPEIIDEEDEKKSIDFLQQSIRSNTQYVRNWGYFSQVIRISKDIFAKFDTTVQKYEGFTITEVICFFELLMNHIEKQINNCKRQINSIFP